MARPKSTKNTEVETVKNEETMNKAKNTTMEKITNEVASFQTKLQKTLGELVAEVSSKLAIGDTLDAANDLRRSEAERLRQIEIQASTLEDLKAQIAQITDDKVKLEKDLADNRVKEASEYAYRLKVAREQDADAWAKQRAERVAVLDTREKELQEREELLADLNTQVAGHQAAIDAAVKAAVGKAEAIQSHKFETEKKIAAAEMGTEKALTEAKIVNLQERIESLQEANNDLREQLVQVQKDAKDQISEALKAVSGQNTLQAVQNAVQASTGGKVTK